MTCIKYNVTVTDIHMIFKNKSENVAVHVYYSYRSSLMVKWENFHDPQSGIHQYDWCISTLNGTCDVHPPTLAHLSTMQVVTGLSLDFLVPYTVHVTATNNVGLSVSGHSLPFVVDVSPPECLEPPQFDKTFSLSPNTQFDRSVVSLTWSFNDAESPVWTHSVSLLTHHNGKVPMSRVLVGDVNHTVISLSSGEQLKDGNRYVAKVDACNAAGLCTSAQSEELLIDSSPPEIGGFVEPLSWQNVGQGSLVSLSWQGFDDAHSGIQSYHIMISSSYNGNDISGRVLTVAHNGSADVQEYTASLSGKIIPYSMIYLTIWAENAAGLLSDTAKVGVFALKSGHEQGRLDIEKHSCDYHYCNLDCTCAVLHRPCSPGDSIPECLDALPVSVLQLTDGTPNHLLAITSSSTCLRAFWKQVDTSVPILRYEWTVGLKGDEPGVPIFDVINDKVWHDTDLQEESLYCLPGNRSLAHGLEFVYYIRAWHDFDKFSMYESSGVLVDTTPPRVTSRPIREMDNTFSTELDFTTNTSVLYLDWTSVFRDPESGIDHYVISVGTTPGGNEIHGPIDMRQANRTILDGLSLNPGQKYFTTVYAYNSLGMVTSLTSDGIMVDLEVPLPGVVFTSAAFIDAAHRTESIHISWHGFEDVHSFIHHYEWTIGEASDSPNTLLFKSSKLETSVALAMEELGLVEGKDYVAYVRAVDAAGHVSPAVASNVFSVDQSPPEGYICAEPVLHLSNISLACLPCENTAACGDNYRTCIVNNSISLLPGQACKIMLHTTKHQPELRARLQVANMFDWIHLSREGPDTFTHTSVYVADGDEHPSPVVHQYSGDASLLKMDVIMCGHTNRTLTPITIHQTGPIGVNLKWSIEDKQSGIRSFRVGLGTSPGGFQLLTLTDVGVSSTASFPVSLTHGMEVHAVVVAENNAGLITSFSVDPLIIDWSPPFIDQLHVMVQEMGKEFIISATWTATDEESHLQDCHWALGKSHTLERLVPCFIYFLCKASGVVRVQFESCMTTHKL